MAINLCDLANILDKIVLSEHWKWLFRASRFQHVLKGKKTPDPPSGSPTRSVGSPVIQPEGGNLIEVSFTIYHFPQLFLEL